MLPQQLIWLCRSRIAAQPVFLRCQLFIPTQRHGFGNLAVELNMKPNGAKWHNMMEDRRLHHTWSALKRQDEFGTHSPRIGYAIAQSTFRHLYQPPYPWLRTMILTETRWKRGLRKHVSLSIRLQPFGKLGSAL